LRKSIEKERKEQKEKRKRQAELRHEKIANNCGNKVLLASASVNFRWKLWISKVSGRKIRRKMGISGSSFRAIRKLPE
jgi:hypothetical protein